jgi:hypothetical protein
MISDETPKKLRELQTITAKSIPCHKQIQAKQTKPALILRLVFHFDPIIGL